MDHEQQMAIINEFSSSDVLNLNLFTIFASHFDDGRSAIIFAASDQTGKKYQIPFSLEDALQIGEAIVRAVDAFDDGLVS